MLVVAGLGWIAGCASIGPPLPPSLELPKPPTDLRAARKGDRVTLTWTIPELTTDRERVRYLGKTRVCRTLATSMKQCETQVGAAAAPADFPRARKAPLRKVAGTAGDTLSAAVEQEHPTGFATYAVEVLNAAGRGAGISNQVHVALVPTLAPFGGFRAKTNSQGVMISWECRESGTSGAARHVFRIYRRAEGTEGASRIAELDAAECAGKEKEQSFLDQTFEWENIYFYRGTLVSVLEIGGRPRVEVEGDDTPEVKVFAHDIFPPAVPGGLQAVFSGTGQTPFVDLIWAPVTDADLAGYNVYRHEEGAPAAKMNVELVKSPAFRDEKVEAGKNYFYSVTAVDQRGNESGRSEESGERVP